MNTVQLEESLLLLADKWRTKAKQIENKFHLLNSAQTQIAVEAIKTCAADLEDEVKFFRRSRPIAKS